MTDQQWCPVCHRLLPRTHYSPSAKDSTTCVSCRAAREDAERREAYLARKVKERARALLRKEKAEAEKRRKAEEKRANQNARHLRVLESGPSPPALGFDPPHHRVAGTILYPYRDTFYTARELSAICGIPVQTLRQRIDRGMSVQDAMDAGAAMPRGHSHRYFEYRGKTYTVKELAELVGVSYHAMLNRLRRHNSVELAVNGRKKPEKPRASVPRQVEYKGKTYTVGELAAVAGITRQALHMRLLRGMPVELAVELGANPSGRRFVRPPPQEPGDAARPA